MYKIVKSECLADKIYLMDVEAPRIARACQPGEFVIVKMDEVGERIPLTICDYDREKGLITIVFQIVGASTERMAGLKAGDSFADFVGPLGQPSEFVKDDLEEVKKRRYLFVAGGVGSAPVYPQVKWLKERGIDVDVVEGAKTKDMLILEEEMRSVAGNLGPEFDGHLVDFDQAMKRQQMYKTEEGRAILRLREGTTHHGGCGNCGGEE